MDLSRAVVHYTVTTSGPGPSASYETWATAAGSVSIGNENGRVAERGTTPTSASIWSPERDEVVTARTPAQGGGGDGLSLDEVSVVRDGRATVTQTTFGGRQALQATARGGVLVFDARTLVPLEWRLTGPAGETTMTYRA